jgi:hypothetical protein
VCENIRERETNRARRAKTSTEESRSDQYLASGSLEGRRSRNAPQPSEVDLGAHSEEEKHQWGAPASTTSGRQDAAANNRERGSRFLGGHPPSTSKVLGQRAPNIRGAPVRRALENKKPWAARKADPCGTAPDSTSVRPGVATNESHHREKD